MIDRRQMISGAIASVAALAIAEPVGAAAARPKRHGGRALRGRGIGYDTGFYDGGTNTHESFDRREVTEHMRSIRRDLSCNVVRVTGGNQDRLEVAARAAASVGLDVWYSPFVTDLTQDAMLDFLAESARRAEAIRRRGTDVVLVAGAELSLFVSGFIPGETFHDRIAFLTTPSPDLVPVLQQVSAKLDAFFERAVPIIRRRFRGQVSYASLGFEQIDWTPFDFVSHDFYPNQVNGSFAGAVEALQSLKAHGKPVAITEFGCSTFDGASAIAGQGHAAVRFDGRTTVALELAADYRRDEQEQAKYVCDLLDIFEQEGIDAAFVHTFAQFHLPTRGAGRQDLDLASYGVNRVIARHGTRSRIEPKRVAREVARLYRRW